MIETLNSVGSLETLLKELEPELPFCVYFLGPLLGSERRWSEDVWAIPKLLRLIRSGATHTAG